MSQDNTLNDRRLEHLLQLLNREVPGDWSRCETPEGLRFPYALTVQMQVTNRTIYVTQSINHTFPSSLRHDVRISPHLLGSMVFLMSGVPSCVKSLVKQAFEEGEE